MSTLEKKKNDKERTEKLDIKKLKEEKEISDDKLKLIEASIKGLEITEEDLKATMPVVKAITKVDLSKEQRAFLEVEFEDSLPKWVKAPWMYIKPKKESQVESWLESWSAIVLDYSRIFVIHIININEIRNVHPFNNAINNKKMSLKQVREVIDHLVKQSVAKWLDEKTKTRARIYWKTNEEWADNLLDFMIETGRVVEIHSLFDLSQLQQQWSDLPADDLIIVCEMLVENKVAKWLNKEKTIIQFEADKVF
ncbi:MAG: hypothetical protein H7647_12270 [Candidatus Heimdallarchaeota archaeon]|nr:hypothetical protein [Candidatus Heimdallarchaeota archaeon]MCK4255201.1 hypothetical protein [Candidatus Heimdallarchaeota archaeon]